MAVKDVLFVGVVGLRDHLNTGVPVMLRVEGHFIGLERSVHFPKVVAGKHFDDLVALTVFKVLVDMGILSNRLERRSDIFVKDFLVLVFFDKECSQGTHFCFNVKVVSHLVL